MNHCFFAHHELGHYMPGVDDGRGGAGGVKEFQFFRDIFSPKLRRLLVSCSCSISRNESSDDKISINDSQHSLEAGAGGGGGHFDQFARNDSSYMSQHEPTYRLFVRFLNFTKKKKRG